LTTSVRVWLVRPDDEVVVRELDRSVAWLDEDERARQQQLQRPADRRLHLAAHLLLRAALSRCADVAPQAWHFSRAEDGRPHIAAAAAGLAQHFSLAHTRGLVVCAIADAVDVGVDIEPMRSLAELDGMARIALGHEERADLASLPVDARSERFLVAWTIKEAYAKACGVAAALPFDQVAVRFEGAQPLCLSFARALADEPLAWRLHGSRCAGTFVLGIAARAGVGASVEFVINEGWPAR